MITRPNLLDGLLLGLLILLLDDLRIIFYDPRQFSLGKNVLPKIIRHESVGIGGIAGSVIIAFIEGQKPAVFSCKFCTELDRCVVYGKMYHAALE